MANEQLLRACDTIMNFDFKHNVSLMFVLSTQSCGQRRSSSGATTTAQQQSAAASATTAAAGCSHRRPSMPQTKRTCQQPTFVHQDELWLTQTQRHANRSPPPVTRGLLNNNVDSPTDDGKRRRRLSSGTYPGEGGDQWGTGPLSKF